MLPLLVLSRIITVIMILKKAGVVLGQLSPMMQQYMETKEQYKDCILF